MKRVVIFLLCFFLLCDFVLALFLFNAMHLRSMIEHPVTIASTSKIRATISNKYYLYEKLDEAGFWTDKGVYFYGSNLFVSVKELEIVLTDDEQKWSKRTIPIDEKTKVTAYSYGQNYDITSQKMRLTLHVYPADKTPVPLAQRYNTQLLVAIFDSTHVGKYKNNTEGRKMWDNFIKDGEEIMQKSPILILK